MSKNKQLIFYALILFLVLPLEAQIKFKDVTKKAGLYEPLKGMAGHNATWGDVNEDGYPDLFFGNFTHFYDSTYNKRGHTEGKQPNKFFLNQGNGKFKEVEDSPVRVMGKNSGGAFADFDNDGDLDLVISHQSHLKVFPGDLPPSAIERNRLFENDGNGNLSDVTEASGLDFGYPFLGRTTFVFDYDGDGLLDLFMQEDRVLSDISGGNSRLMRNTGGLVFKDVTAEAGFPTGFQTGLYGLGGFVDDVNGDSWPDIFFAHSCRLFINNANGTFHEKEYDMVPEKISQPAPGNMDWTCGANTGDVDNDGDMDFVLGDHYRMDGSFHHLYLFLNEGNDANGDPLFREIANEAGIPDPDNRIIHMQLEDVDNDGLIDILTSRYSCFIYKNEGVSGGLPRFQGPISSGHEEGLGYAAGGPFCDYDRDGRIDFIGPEWYAYAHSPLLRNITKGAKNYINVQVDLASGPNRNGIGARVEIYKAGMLGRDEGLLCAKILSVTNGYSSGYEPLAHIGLPNDQFVDIRVSMPCDGPVYTATHVERNQFFTITE